MRPLPLLLLLAACSDHIISDVKDPPAEPALVVNPTALSFRAGSDEITSFTVTNAGLADLEVTSVAVRAPGGFTLTQAGGLPGTLGPEGTTTLEVTWAPSGDDESGWLDLVSNDPDDPTVAVALSGFANGGTGDSGSGDSGTGDSGTGDSGTGDSGTGDSGPTLSPELTLDPGSANFSAEIGSSFDQAFTVHNIGTAAGSVDLVAVSGVGYSLQSSLVLPVTVDVGGSVELLVRFAPTFEGASSGQLEVTTGAGDVMIAPLVGEGVAPASGLPLSYTWTGSAQSWTVPAGISTVTVLAWGGGGGAGNYSGAYPGAGGGGGYASLNLSVSAGDLLTLRPGQGGRMPGGGGGASVVEHNGVVVLVAGGGGGGGTDGGSLLGGSGAGGAGGGDDGVTGGTQSDAYWGYAAGGTGGSLASGGVGGAAAVYAGSGVPCTGSNGASLLGGAPPSGSSCTMGTAATLDSAGLGSSNGAGGGGGSGWYGGGAGGSMYTYFGGGGGGGSSWAPGGSTLAGSGDDPGNMGDAARVGNAGAGGVPGVWPGVVSTDGTGGLIVLQ